MRLTLALLAVLIASCTFITATGFDECKVDTDCAASSVCMEKYCIKMEDGCTRGAGDFTVTDHVKLAAILPLSADSMGTRDESQYAGLNSYVMALEEMNRNAGTGAHPFAMYVCDTQRSSDIAKKQAKWMAEELKVPALIAGGSQQALDIAGASRAAHAMVMSARATSPALVDAFQTATDGLLWRTAPPDSLQGRVLANLILTDPTYTGTTKVGIIYVDDAYGTGLLSELRRKLQAGGKTVTSAPITAGMDVTSAVATIATAAPQVTVVIAVTDDTKRVLDAAFKTTQLKKSAGHKWAFADASKNPSIFTVTGAPAELQGSLGTAPAQGQGIAYPTFSGAYSTKFHIDPGTYAFTANSYDAMYLLGLCASYASSSDRTLDGPTMASAMNRMSSGPQHTIEPTEYVAMRNAINAGQSIDVEGNSGSLAYIPDAGAPYAKIEEWRIADGGFETVANIDPPTN
ncbi:MAG: ABC transporter substrate-binding protein [Archangiaceae bacterium]|nr:ABC transporter substrate-binding protein [Archangiaceae bacterium]